MILLVSVENFHPPRGGGELSLKSILSRLRGDHEIKVLCRGESDRDFRWGGMEISQRRVEEKSADMLTALGRGSEDLMRRFKRDLGRNHILLALNRNAFWKDVVLKALREFEPDIMFTQLNFTPSSVEAAAERGVPRVVFLRSYEHLCPMGFRDRGTDCDRDCARCFRFNVSVLGPVLSRVNAGLARKLQEAHLGALKAADCVISNSRYMSGLTRYWTGVDSEVLYPVIEFDDYRTEAAVRRGEGEGYISFVKPTKTKGAEVVLALAKSCPGRRFMVLGRGNDEYVEGLKGLPNVRYVPWSKDMREVYARTRVILIPSLWPEPFGRVAVECGLNGIPSIASGSGGLREAVGEGGLLIDEPDDVGKWVEALEKLDEPGRYREMSRKALENSKKYEGGRIMGAFKEIIKNRLDKDL